MALKYAVIRSTDRNTWRTKEKETGRVSSTERTKKETNKDTTRFIAGRKSPKKGLSLAKKSVIGPLEFLRGEGRRWCNVLRKKRWEGKKEDNFCTSIESVSREPNAAKSEQWRQRRQEGDHVPLLAYSRDQLFASACAWHYRGHRSCIFLLWERQG